jgi:transposase
MIVQRNKENLIKMLEEGQTPKQIAEAMQLSAGFIYVLIKKLGLKKFLKNAVGQDKKDFQKNTIQHLIEEGLSVEKIAEEMHLNPLTIYRLIKQYKLTRPAAKGNVGPKRKFQL